jgi:palmitoyl transferase
MRVLSILLLAAVAPLAASQEPPDGWGRTVDAIESTTPFPLGSDEEQNKGWLSGAWDGTKRIWSEGSQDLYISGYVWHMPYKWSAERRSSFNNNAWGLGYGRTLADERDNQRMLYAIIATDSYRKPMYMAGYAWLARWPITGELRVGAGYSALLVRHESTADFPVPVVVPLVSVGSNNAALYVTYISGMAYFFGKISFGAHVSP